MLDVFIIIEAVAIDLLFNNNTEGFYILNFVAWLQVIPACSSTNTGSY